MRHRNEHILSLKAESGTNYAVLCGRDTVQIIPEKGRTLTLAEVEEVAKRLGNPYKKTPYFIEMKYGWISV